MYLSPSENSKRVNKTVLRSSLGVVILLFMVWVSSLAELFPTKLRHSRALSRLTRLTTPQNDPLKKNVPMSTALKTGERRPDWYERNVRQTIADAYTQGSASRPTPQVSVIAPHPAGVATVCCTPDTGPESTVII